MRAGGPGYWAAGSLVAHAGPGKEAGLWGKGASRPERRNGPQLAAGFFPFSFSFFFYFIFQSPFQIEF